MTTVSYLDSRYTLKVELSGFAGGVSGGGGGIEMGLVRERGIKTIPRFWSEQLRESCHFLKEVSSGGGRV